MKKIYLSSFLIITFTGYALHGRILNSPLPISNTVTDVIKPIDPQINNNAIEVIPPVPVMIPSSNIVRTIKTRNNNKAIVRSAPVSDPAIEYVPNPITVSTPDPVYTPAPAPTYVPVPTPDPVPVQTGLYKNGQYTGSVADASYGYVQVVAVISGGKISDVKFLDYPRDAQKSLQKSMYSMPILISEAIAIQDSNVNTVSGASFTSQAYRESLGSALAQAK